jgi:Ca2+-binding RTX toxin-like protein
MTSRTIEAKRVVALLATAIATLLVLSMVVAQDAEAKKKKRHFNLVQCPTEGDNASCFGTSSRDKLVGREEFDQVFGGERNDFYKGKEGSDDLIDNSTTSNDLYQLPSTEFSQLGSGPPFDRTFIGDRGGSSDVLDLRAYESSDFALSNAGDLGSDGKDELFMDGPGRRDLAILNFLSDEDSIEVFKFSDGTFTAEQIKNKVP